MAEHIAPVLTVPQATALLAAIPARIRGIEVALANAAEIDEPPFAISGPEKRHLAAEVRSLRLADTAIRRSLRTLDPEGTPS